MSISKSEVGLLVSAQLLNAIYLRASQSPSTESFEQRVLDARDQVMKDFETVRKLVSSLPHPT